MIAQDVCEQLAHPRHGLLVRLTGREWAIGILAEASTFPYFFSHLRDEGAAMAVVRVAVDLHDAERRRRDVELERVEDLVRAEPHVPAAPLLQGRAEGLRVASAHARVQPV